MRNKMLTAMFILYILIFSIGSIIAKDRVFSDMENRNLAQFPELNTSNVMNGSFTEDFESYMSDQIVFKDSLVRIKVAENLILNQTLINGVYFSEDDMLIQEYLKPYNQLDKNLQYVNEFVSTNPDLKYTWMIIPNAGYIYEDKLPEYAEIYDQQEVMGYIIGNADESVRMVDCSNSLIEARNQYLYYKTDHHWTMDGAYVGYLTLCKELDLKVTPLKDYDISVASDDFLGTLYSNAPSFGQAEDEILIYNNPKGKYTVEYIDDDAISDSFYNYDNLELKDKYTVYMDGNHSLVKIKSNCVNGDSGKLLVIKDSYAHCLIPLLADNFSEIYVVDLRYFHQSVSELAEENGIEQIVFINNIDFLSTDDNFLWLQ